MDVITPEASAGNSTGPLSWGQQDLGKRGTSLKAVPGERLAKAVGSLQDQQLEE